MRRAWPAEADYAQSVSVGSPVSDTTPVSPNIGTIGGAGIASLCPDAATREGTTNLWGMVDFCAGVTEAGVTAADVTNRL